MCGFIKTNIKLQCRKEWNLSEKQQQQEFRNCWEMLPGTKCVSLHHLLARYSSSTCTAKSDLKLLLNPDQTGCMLKMNSPTGMNVDIRNTLVSAWMTSWALKNINDCPVVLTCPQSQSSLSSPVSWRVTPSTLGCLKVLEGSASTLSEEVDRESFYRCTASRLEGHQH